MMMIIFCVHLTLFIYFLFKWKNLRNKVLLKFYIDKKKIARYQFKLHDDERV